MIPGGMSDMTGASCDLSVRRERHGSRSFQVALFCRPRDSLSIAVIAYLAIHRNEE